MAIAIDANSSSTAGTTSPKTWSHTCTGSDLILYVGVWINASGATASATYNGVAMTEVNHVSYSTGGGTAFLFRLINPDTGTNTVSVTHSAYSAEMAVSYTGVNQTVNATNFQNNTQTSESATTLTCTVTTQVDNAWGIMMGCFNGAILTPSAGTVAIGTNAFGGSYETTAAKSPAGSFSLGGSSNDAFCLVMEAFAPVAVSFVKTVNGLAKASVKTVNGSAIASVKTYNGLA